MRFYSIFKNFYQRAAKKMCLDCKDFLNDGSKILDLGCGSGIVGKEFQKYFGTKLIGIDIRDQRVEKIPFRVFNGFSLPFPENSFDAVLMNYVLHHAKDPLSLLKEAKRVSKNKIIIYEDLAEGLLSKIICKIHGASFDYLFQKNKGKNNNFKKNEEWKKTFENLNLKMLFEKRCSSVFNPLEKKLFILEKKC